MSMLDMVETTAETLKVGVLTVIPKPALFQFTNPSLIRIGRWQLQI